MLFVRVSEQFSVCHPGGKAAGAGAAHAEINFTHRFIDANKATFGEHFAYKALHNTGTLHIKH